jgi:hypothetical protein
MAWKDFTLQLHHHWTVSRCLPGCGLTPNDILLFAGDGDGGRGSLLLTDTGLVWASRCRYLGGSGTAADPDLVQVRRRFRRFTIQRRAGFLACYRGAAAGASEPVWTAEQG